MKTTEKGYDELLGALKLEEDNAKEFYNSELMDGQIEAMEQYYGEPYGDEAPDRSSVVTREVMETIEWIRPDLQRVFSASKQPAEFEATTPQNAGYVRAATQYCSWIFFEDNDGDKVLDAFAFDGLLQRIGFVGVWWEDAEHGAPQELTGLNSQQAQEIIADPSVEVVEVADEERAPDEFHPDGIYVDMTVRPIERDGRVKVLNIAPEDMRIGARATSLEDCRYIGRIVRTTKSDLRREFPDHASIIDDLGPSNDEEDYDERRQARFNGEEDPDEADFREGSREIILFEEYIRFDKDGDGFDEFLAVKRVNDHIFECVEVEDHPFAHWTPIPIPHRLYGLGIWDVMKDIQRTKTVLLRAALDATYQAVVPRVAADISTVNVGDLLTAKPGGVIRVRGEPRAALQPIAVPDLSPSALSMMEFVDQIGESRSGITRNAQGIDPDALNKTATGIKLMQNAASARKEQIARNMARGIEVLFRKIYRTVVRHQNAARVYKVTGKTDFAVVDPRSWDADLKCSVHAGLGTGDREAHLAMLDRVLAMQERWWQAFGPDNGVITPQHLHNTATDMVTEMGYRSAERFFGPVENFKQPQPQPDPKVQIEQEKLKIDQQKAAQDAQIKKEELAQKLQIEREEMAAKLQLQREQMMAELEIKRQQLSAELGIKRELGLANAATTPVRMGGNPG